MSSVTSTGASRPLTRTAELRAPSQDDVSRRCAGEGRRRGGQERTSVDPKISCFELILPCSRGSFGEPWPLRARSRYGSACTRARPCGSRAELPRVRCPRTQVMIEDDVVRYAERFSPGRPTPSDIVYVHDFDHPEAHGLFFCPQVLVRRCQADGRAHRTTSRDIAAVAEGDDLSEPRRSFPASSRPRIGRLFGSRIVGQDLASVCACSGWHSDLSHPSRQTRKREQFDVLDESTRRALASPRESSRERSKRLHSWFVLRAQASRRRAVRSFEGCKRAYRSVSRRAGANLCGCGRGRALLASAVRVLWSKTGEDLVERDGGSDSEPDGVHATARRSELVTAQSLQGQSARVT